MTLSTRPTAAEPMAFSGVEVVKGAIWTWLSFMVVLEMGMAIYMIVQTSEATSETFLAGAYFAVLVLGYVAIYGGLVSLLATIVLTPVAWVIGRMLRRQRSLGLHLLVYTALGCTVAALVIAVISGFGGDIPSALKDPVVAIVLIATVTCVPTGWWLAARGALRSRGVSG